MFIRFTLEDGRRVEAERLPNGRYRVPSAHGDYVIVKMPASAGAWYRATPWRVDVPYATRSVSYYPTLRMALEAVEAERVAGIGRSYGQPVALPHPVPARLSPEVRAHRAEPRHNSRPVAIVDGWPIYTKAEPESARLEAAAMAQAGKDGR